MSVSKQSNFCAYWRANLCLMAWLLGIWFLVSLACGVVFAEPLNRIEFFDYPLGHWFVQKGACYLFILETLYFIWHSRRIERKYASCS